MARDITSANASATLVTTLFPAGLKLEQFSADSAWTQEAYQVLEHRIGVDGKMVAGYTPSEKEITFSFEANSPSLDGLDLIWQTMEVAKQPMFCQIAIQIPSIKKSYALVNCLLTNYKLLPNAERTLAPVDATFTVESITSVKL